MISGTPFNNMKIICYSLDLVEIHNFRSDKLFLCSKIYNCCCFL